MHQPPKDDCVLNLRQYCGEKGETEAGDAVELANVNMTRKSRMQERWWPQTCSRTTRRVKTRSRTIPTMRGSDKRRRTKWIGHHLSQTHLMEQANRRAWTRKNPEQNPRKHEDPPLQQQKPKLITALQQRNISKKSMRKREPCTRLNQK